MDQQATNHENPTAANAKNENSVTHITIKVQREREHDIYFRIKHDAPLRRLMHAYCDRLGLQYGVIRFFFDGKRVKDFHTADDLEMTDGDTIDAMNDQLGGSALFGFLV